VKAANVEATWSGTQMFQRANAEPYMTPAQRAKVASSGSIDALGNVAIPAALMAGLERALPADDNGLVQCDVVVRSGKIAAITEVGTYADALDCGGQMLLPRFHDLHTHLDMGHLADKAPNPEGTHFGAVLARDKFRAHAIARGESWRDADLERRMEFSIRCACAHGSIALRSHLDSLPEQAEQSWTVFERLRDRWRGKIELQGAALLPVDHYLTEYGTTLADRVARANGVLGGVTRLSGQGHGPAGPTLRAAVERTLQLAAERDLDVDFHVDETGDPNSRSLDLVIDAVRKTGFKGRVTCGHCCALAIRDENDAMRTVRACADAGIAIVSLPHCNLYLQDRGVNRTPRWRGITLLHEFAQAGVPVAIASDNCRDYFYAYGDHDQLANFALAALAAHLDRPYGHWLPAICSTPAAIIGSEDAGLIQINQAANFILFTARRFSELLARPQTDRVVFNRGVVSDAALPPFSDLDSL
jgi:cytosine/creatinine deaminase